MLSENDQTAAVLNNNGVMQGIPGHHSEPISATIDSVDWQPQVFEPVQIAMPKDGEARKRISMYETEVMMPS